MYLVEKMQMTADRALVADVVRSCQMCKQIDPAPVAWEHGSLDVSLDWQRIAADVAYVGGKPYLTVVDCGPSRFAIWIALNNETADQAIKHLRRIFLERGPPQELLCDYGPCFKSSKTRGFLRNWGVSLIFCCAYKHSGNGIVERNHRTIKRMVARTGKSPEDMVFWYNNTPSSANVIPAAATYRYQTRLPGEPVVSGLPGDRRAVKAKANPYRAGDSVFVKPGKARCDTRWNRQKVTKIVSDTVIEVNGINRHIADVRRDGTDMEFETHGGHRDIEICIGNMNDRHEQDNENLVHENNPEYSDSESASSDNDSSDQADEARPDRDRRPPRWLADFYVD
jgi:hypothetical protein